MPNPYQSDIDHILALRHTNGGDFWATADGRVYAGNPFSTVNAAFLLSELGVGLDDPAMRGAVELVLSKWRADGRFAIAPGSVYPCQTAQAVRLLCRLGLSEDERVQTSFQHLLATQHGDGGWRCNKFFFGHGPETEFSNPGPTLEILDTFRYTAMINREERLDRAVEFLLRHWETRLPLGPCHYGIGKQFLRVEFPFLKYNIFYYVYVLSFYDCARGDRRFQEALSHLQSRLVDGQVVVEETNPKLRQFAFCRKGAASAAATARYAELMNNIK